MGIHATEALSPSPTIIGAERPGSVIAGKSGLAGACVRGTILNAEMVPSAPKIKPIQSSTEETRRAREPEPSQARRANAASDHYAAGGRDGRLQFLQQRHFLTRERFRRMPSASRTVVSSRTAQSIARAVSSLNSRSAKWANAFSPRNVWRGVS